MKLYIHITHGKRGKFWWKLVDENNNTRAICPSPGFDTTEAAHYDAFSVLEATDGDPDGAVPVSHERRHWWQFWRGEH